MAIESADVLGQCLAQGGEVVLALQAYETHRQRRTAFITNQSWPIGRVAQGEEQRGS